MSPENRLKFNLKIAKGVEGIDEVNSDKVYGNQ